MKLIKKEIVFILLLVILQAKIISLDPISSISSQKFSNITEVEKSKLQKTISKKLPDLIIEEITVSPLPDIYQITASNEIFYISKDGKYLFHGDLLDLKAEDTNEFNHTEEARKKIRLGLLNKILKNEMIIFSPETKTKAKSFVTIFTDLDCMFCQRFHKEINKITEFGIEVHYLIFPRQGVGTENYNKTISVLCADDPKAMFTLASEGGKIASKICESSIKKNLELGRKLNVRGTPTIIFADGAMVASYMSVDTLAQLALTHKLSNTEIIKQ